jgi:FlaA1/EpsC-like NDP-sugar epimerase
VRLYFEKAFLYKGICYKGKEWDARMQQFFKGKRILVTGGTGSVGSEVVRQALACGPAVVRVFSRGEHGQYRMQEEFREHGARLRFLVGDVRDAARVALAVDGIDVVFHAAALKHVPVCEYNPFEAVKTNVMGTQNLIDACMAAGVGRMITVSTDKAVSPINTMGATKLLAERLTAAANLYKGGRDIRFASVRFGNVLGSRGSVVPRFARQVRSGGPVTITHENMTRFFMTIPQAVSLVLESCMAMRGGEVFILKMPVFRILDLVDILIQELAPRLGRDPAAIEKTIVGLRPGERLYEDLLTQEEALYVQETGSMYVLEHGAPRRDPHQARAYRSADQQPVSKEQLRDFILKEKILDDPALFTL